jgi:hypothetical protein
MPLDFRPSKKFSFSAETIKVGSNMLAGDHSDWLFFVRLVSLQSPTFTSFFPSLERILHWARGLRILGLS